ncbi:hypothetical protein [Psychrobacter sp. Ps7]|uniref:hypothetical protein n=1 Tax=Psychrobacter sp. Ps7 TaxID=2790961 RepID=UPI001EE10320|nr:hypothetical protein [Psychrobacter sp. Ps7]MCG3873864.1 hypothetical protein [Psychrobacter sp. Ps7]
MSYSPNELGFYGIGYYSLTNTFNITSDLLPTFSWLSWGYFSKAALPVRNVFFEFGGY